jgi:hypothetical protein
MLMPRRLRLSGLVSSPVVDSSAAKPFSVSLHSASAPPVRTASHSPDWTSLQAAAIDFALEVHAVETI